MATGKDICNQLRKIRVEIAKRNGIDFSPAVCDHKGDCSGTCPVCEQELEYLQKKIEEKRAKGENVVDFKKQGFIPVDKVETDNPSLKESKENIKPKFKIMNIKENLEHIDALQKSLSEEWAAVEISKFSKELEFDVLDGVILLQDDDRFIRNEKIKFHSCTESIDTIIGLEDQIDHLETLRSRYDTQNKEAGETRHIDRSVALKKIEMLTYNIEKIKKYNPVIPSNHNSFGDFELMRETYDTEKIKKEIDKTKEGTLVKIKDYIKRISDRWDIKNYELDTIGERVDEMIIKEESNSI